MSRERGERRERTASQSSQEEGKERKRKREKKTGKKEEEEKAIHICKKTIRTPEKEKGRQKKIEGKGKEGENMEEQSKKLEEILQILKTIQMDNQDIRKEIKLLRKEAEEKEERWREEKKRLETRVAEMERKVELDERQKRRRNIIIKGWTEEGRDKDNVKKSVENFLKTNIAEVRIRNSVRIGKGQLLVELENNEDKGKIMKEKKKLRENQETKKIYIDNDLTKKEREIQAKIGIRARAERERGKRVRQGYKKIDIDGTKWVWDETKQELKVFQ